MDASDARLEPIRLVVWDLDETFWRGTLTEGGIAEHVAATEDTVRELARRGIVSSICSKNDHAAVQAILTERGLWDFFVFPSIAWTPKGARVAAIVDAIQLRAETVLFIDDSASNRAEVAEAVPGIQVCDESVVPALLDHPLAAGKDDGSLSRLKQYRLLEARSRERGREGDDNASFLRTSGIRVEIDHDVEAHLDRVVELINRTNQLNFTKSRLSEDKDVARQELKAQLHATSGRRAAVVRVRDRFGDYGIVGFWMMDGIWVEPYLLHFAFSCRVLGMGVEQWVYARLGRPRLDVVGDVVSTLDDAPDWINLPAGGASEASASRPAPERVRLRGGCELEVLRHFFSFAAREVSSAFVFPRHGQTVWASHAATLFAQPAARTAEGAAALAAIGFRPDDLESRFFEPATGPTCLVLSNSADAHVPLYRHRRLDLAAPVKLFGIDLAAPADDAAIAGFCRANGLSGERAEAFGGWIRTLQRDWAPVAFDDAGLPVLYERIAAAVPPDSLLVVILPLTYADAPDGGTVAFPDQERANDWMRAVAARHGNVAVVDTAECLRSRTELRKMSHLHFARDVYHRLYERIVAIHDARARAGSAVYTQGRVG
ncbi:HAD-IIIC family phosphatase [Lichenibacterium ramalinae]|uniref:HAD-IIIC family phosphatase n=1 Tax=Lichenibacterium ramalinae TaxID=2316527 RepID=UPI0013E9C962|nr:HAD-IIIC family phosphatase [Lichenibacterium ramalinae]